LEKRKEKKKTKVCKATVEPQTIGIAAITPNHTPQAAQRFPDKVTFLFELPHAMRQSVRLAAQ